MKTKKYSIISLDKFITKSLYEKNTGYYMSKNPFGKKGDFITSPNILQKKSDDRLTDGQTFWKSGPIEHLFFLPRERRSAS